MKFDMDSKSLATLLLIIFGLISASDYFDNIYTSPLGRILMIILLVIISFLDKLNGVIALFFVIVIIMSKPKKSTKDGFRNNIDPLSTKPSIHVVTNLPEKRSSSSGEGVDLIGREHSLTKGKQSKSISVDKKVNSSDNILPNDNVFAKENFTTFK